MVTTELNITGKVREKTGKGASRRARREGLVPAVLYSKELAPVHLDLPGHEIFLITKDSANAVVNVSYGDDEQLALVWGLQRHPVRRDILHVDLLAVSAKERVDVEVPLIIIGEPVPGAQLQQDEFEVPLSAPATAIPESIDVDISEMEIGTLIQGKDLPLPEGSELDEELKERDFLSIIEIQEIEIEEEEDSGEDLEEAEEEVEEATEED